MPELVPVLIGGRVAAYRPAPEDSAPKSYSSMLKADLEAEVAKRGLDATGTKADLIEALEADDDLSE